MGLMKLLQMRRVKPKFKITVVRFDGLPLNISSWTAKEIVTLMGNSREKQIYIGNERCKITMEETVQ